MQLIPEILDGQEVGHPSILPRSISKWDTDAARFGSTYLSKFGWDPSKGLGATGEGRISHLKVAQKLDMLGIGAAQQNDVNGIAWKQNKDFEALLRRLNESTGDEAKGSVEMLEIKIEEDEYEVAGQGEKGRKKRKKGQDGEREESVDGTVEGSKKDKKRRKKDRDGGADDEDVDGNKEKKRRKKDKAGGSDIELDTGTPANDIPDDDQPLSEPSSSASVTPAPPPPTRRPAMRHRA